MWKWISQVTCIYAVVTGMCAAQLAGCSAAPEGSLPSPANEAESGSAIQLNLTTQTLSGNTYRLGPATFGIQAVDFQGTPLPDVSPVAIDASGNSAVLHVPVDAGDYTVTLAPGWTLQHADPAGAFTPIAATLVSVPTQNVHVASFATTRVDFGFHLGEAGIDIGVSVEEGIPPGYDGVIFAISQGGPTVYGVTVRDQGNTCCFDSPEQARESFPGLQLFLAPSQ